MKNPIIKTIIIVSSLILLSSCTHEKKWKIGVSQCSTDDWRNKMNEEIMRQALILDDNVEIEIRSANDSSERQIEDLQYFVDNGFDLIAVAPNETESLTPAVRAIYESGTPVIVFDRTVSDDSYTAFQGADNASIGRQAAKLVYSYLGDDARIIEIEGLRSSAPAEYRKKGFHHTADSLGMNIIASAEGRWNYDDAVRVTDSLLDIYPDVNVIYAHNDRMAIGASDVLERRGMRDRVKVIGIDAAPEIGIKAVSEGKIDASFVYPTEGQTLVATAMAILKGEEYNKTNLLPTPSAVDGTNAEILLFQYQDLCRETRNIADLKSRIDQYWQQHSLQTAVLYGALIIVVLLGLVIFLLLRAYWSGRRHHVEVEERNRELQRQRDELDDLYHKLEDATASKLTFFTNVSHDLRTPLTLIADPVEQLSKADNLTAEQHTLMGLANKNVKRLLRLVGQILDIRRYDNGHLALNLEDVDLAEAMREWMEPFAEAAGRRHVRFTLDIAPDCEYHTAVDMDKIERVMFNLLSNAFKFTPANGEVRVAVRANSEQQTANSAHQGDDIVISVSDTGIGIKPEEVGQVFERFFKSGSEVNPNGSGIGLALSKVFVEMHGGTISVDSAPGKGTEFTVTIPVRSSVGQVVARQANATRSDRSTAGNGGQSLDAYGPSPVAEELLDVEMPEIECDDDAQRVLVIDDSEDIFTLVATVLGKDYVVMHASGGAQGIRMALKYIPDLVICDVMMPGIDGYETCRRLKGEELTAHIPVLLLTACAREEQRTEGYECGADGYMTKPFDSAMLKARCKSLIVNSKQRTANSQQTLARQAISTKDGSGVSCKPGDLRPQSPENGANRGQGLVADSPRSLTSAAVTDEFYVRFMAVVERRLGNSELSVEDIAAELGLSRVQMYRKVKALTNYSPAEVLRNTRLEYAARLLKTTQRTVSEIAYEVGFTAPGYFAKCYKEYFMETPTDTQSRTSRIK